MQNLFPRRIPFLLILLMSLIPASGLFAHGPALQVASSAEQGQAVALMMSVPSGQRPEDITVEIVTSSHPFAAGYSAPDRAVTEAQRQAMDTVGEEYPVRVDGKIVVRSRLYRTGSLPGRTVYTGLAALPLDAEPGPCRLIVRGRIGFTPFRLMQPFTIEPGRWSVQNLHLTRSMSNIMRQPDPRKQIESRELAELIWSADPEGYHSAGRFQMPVASQRITSQFGLKRRYLYPDGVTSETRHNGVDYGAPAGTPVYAPAAGRVVMALPRIVTGLTVVIEHLPGVYTLYYHLEAINCHEGQIVKPGDLIGRLGSTGFSTGPHLHWEMRVHGLPVDPRRYLDRPLLDKAGILGMIFATEQKGR